MQRLRKNRQVTKHSKLTLFTTAVAVLALAACGSGSGDADSDSGASDDTSSSDSGEAPTAEDLVELAKKEGRITVYASMAPGLIEPLVEAYTAEYGIDVELIRVSSSQLAARFAEEKNGGVATADILQISEKPFLEQSVEEGWLVDNNDLEAPDNWTSGDWNGYFAVAATGPMGVAYNTENVDPADVPQSWEDVLDPKWKDEILFVDTRGSTVWMAWLLAMKEEFGPEFLEGLSKQNLKVVSSNVPGSQQIAAGEAKIIFPTVPWAIQDLTAQGAPVANAPTFETTTLLDHFIGQVSDSEKPNASRLFMEFALSEAGQTALTGTGFAASAVLEIDGAADMPKNILPVEYERALEEANDLMSSIGLE